MSKRTKATKPKKPFRTKGTKEWASSNVNPIRDGCEGDCLYCYARGRRCVVGKEIPFADWGKGGVVNERVVNKNYGKRSGRIMLPTSSDITPRWMEVIFSVVEKILKAGNTVLLTSKPRYEVIETFCSRFARYKSQVEFRFTVTGLDEEVIKFWERSAPPVSERMDAAKFAFDHDWQTSFSVEPFLDPDPGPLVRQLLPVTTETIWVGLANFNLVFPDHIYAYDPRGKYYYPKLREQHQRDPMKKIYADLKDVPKIRWKDSVGNLLGIDDINGYEQQRRVTLLDFIGKKV